MACYNPVLAQERSRKRQALLDATEQGLTKSDESKLTLKQIPAPTPIQRRAYELLGLLPVEGT